MHYEVQPWDKGSGGERNEVIDKEEDGCLVQRPIRLDTF